MEKLITPIVLVLVLGFICWKEIRRKNQASLILRLVASIFAVIALYFIAVPPYIQRKMDSGKENTAVLLTEGFEEDSLTGLKNIPLFSTERVITENNRNVQFIPDLEYFTSSHPDFNKFHVLGNGLDEHEIELFKPDQLIFHPSDPSGFRSVHWKSTIRSGDRLIVQGNFINPSQKPVELILKGLSTTLDSFNIPSNKKSTFELSSIPKLLDKAIYSIIALSGRDTISNEKIPVIIEERKALKILLISSTPGFEIKFLKNWLYAENYALAVRTSISKDKFSTEFLNTERTSLNRINPGLLEKFDVLIGDMTELSLMSAGENAAVQNQISKGMGLLIRADGETTGGGFYKRVFNISAAKGTSQGNLTLNWPGTTAKKIAKADSRPMQIVQDARSQALLKDGQGQVLVSSKQYGAGRIILSTLADTYTWMLGNKPDNYSSYWSFIIEKAARKTELKENWSIFNGFPTINEETMVHLETSSDTIPSALSGGNPLRFMQDPVQSFLWTAEHWPAKGGWQSISTLGSKSQSWYVFDQNDWKSVKASQKITNTQKFISAADKNEKATGQSQKLYTYTPSAIYFFALFILCCSYLWLEAKLL